MSQKGQRGFSLIELLVVLLMISVIVGAIFAQLAKVQIRYRAEDQKVDLTQQERDFIDQFTRDLHQAGYPTRDMYGNRLDYNSARISAGVWYVSATDVWMEGDLDDNERVQETRYHYDDGSSWSGPGPNPCPCIRRSSVTKIDGYYPWDSHQATPQYYTEVQNLVAPAANQPLFQIYDSTGKPVPMNSGSLVLGSGTAVDPTALRSLESIKAIRITLTTQAPVKDSDGNQTIQVTMTGTARLPNN